MADMHNGAVVPSEISPPRATRAPRDTHMMWEVIFAVLFVAAVAAIVVTALQGLTTTALIIAIFTGAFFSRCAC
jgi:hypothetical protein